MRPIHVGVYQRPAPPKTLRRDLSAVKSIQKPAVPLHEIEAQTRDLMEEIQGLEELEGFAESRKGGRPPIHGRAMTPAERQRRRRAIQSQEKAIREVLRIGDAHGKSRAEARSGGYDSAKLDIMVGHLEAEQNEDGDHVGRHVRAAEGHSSAADEQTGFEEHEVQEIEVRGLRTGNEKANRRLFAESELRRMVDEYFTSPDKKTPSASWTARHNGNISVQRYQPPTITLVCKLCPDSMDSIEDAQDHLRVDHRTVIDEWFGKLEPRRKFRDMGQYVTIVTPRKK